MCSYGNALTPRLIRSPGVDKLYWLFHKTRSSGNDNYMHVYVRARVSVISDATAACLGILASLKSDRIQFLWRFFFLFGFLHACSMWRAPINFRHEFCSIAIREFRINHVRESIKIWIRDESTFSTDFYRKDKGYGGSYVWRKVFGKGDMYFRFSITTRRDAPPLDKGKLIRLLKAARKRILGGKLLPCHEFHARVCRRISIFIFFFVCFLLFFPLVSIERLALRFRVCVSLWRVLFCSLSFLPYAPGHAGPYFSSRTLKTFQ